MQLGFIPLTSHRPLVGELKGLIENILKRLQSWNSFQVEISLSFLSQELWEKDAGETMPLKVCPCHILCQHLHSKAAYSHVHSYL